jgi:N,N'-diacetyllegionaminate synthase
LMIRHIRDIERALGSGEKTPMPNELPVRALVRRSVTTVQPVLKGQTLSAENVALLRPGTGIAPKELALAIGKKAVRDLEAGTTLTWSDLA